MKEDYNNKNESLVIEQLLNLYIFGRLPSESSLQKYFSQYGMQIKTYGLTEKIIDIAMERSFTEIIIYIVRTQVLPLTIKVLDKIIDFFIERNGLCELYSVAEEFNKLYLTEEQKKKITNAIIEYKNVNIMLSLVGFNFVQTQPLVDAVDKKVDSLIDNGDIIIVYNFVRVTNMGGLYKISPVSAKKLVNFFINNPNPVCIYEIARWKSFSGIEGYSDSDLLNALITTKDPECLYLFAITVENISDADMKNIVDSMIIIGDTQWMAYLLWYLRDKENISPTLGYSLYDALVKLGSVEWFLNYDSRKTPREIKNEFDKNSNLKMKKFYIGTDELGAKSY